MNRFAYPFAILASSVLGLAACTDDLPPSDPTPTGEASGGDGNTFDHDMTNTISPWELLDRLTKEGPPSFTSHMHSCPKVKYATLGNVLTGVGVNAASTTAVSAGDLYTNGQSALGGANYANRIRENVAITTSGASREFDIFAAGAPEVLAAFTAGTIARCPGVQLFDGSGNCQADGITCLIGSPATAQHVSFCNLTVTSATDKPTGQKLAVAAILAAAYTCE
ncbi:MAG TPA: hypothetical protein VGC41_22870 [Kofleriaceae bacterium]